MQHGSMSLLTNLKKQPVGGEFKRYGQARCNLRKLCGFASVSRCLHSFFKIEMLQKNLGINPYDLDVSKTPYHDI